MACREIDLAADGNAIPRPLMGEKRLVFAQQLERTSLPLMVPCSMMMVFEHTGV